jgi:hypothetical protein
MAWRRRRSRRRERKPPAVAKTRDVSTRDGDDLGHDNEFSEKRGWTSSNTRYFPAVASGESGNKCSQNDIVVGFDRGGLYSPHVEFLAVDHAGELELHSFAGFGDAPGGGGGLA